MGVVLSSGESLMRPFEIRLALEAGRLGWRGRCVPPLAKSYVTQLLCQRRHSRDRPLEGDRRRSGKIIR
jgi:hypothetical protein